MSPVSPVFYTVFTVSIGLKNMYIYLDGFTVVIFRNRKIIFVDSE